MLSHVKVGDLSAFARIEVINGLAKQALTFHRLSLTRIRDRAKGTRRQNRHDQSKEKSCRNLHFVHEYDLRSNVGVLIIT